MSKLHLKDDLVLFYPGCISFEVQLAIELIGNVQAISLDGEDHRDRSGLAIRTHPLSAVDIESCGSLIIPGGNPDTIMGNPAVQELIRNSLTAGCVIGGICAGVLVLADAGVLQNRRITHRFCYGAWTATRPLLRRRGTTKEQLL